MLGRFLEFSVHAPDVPASLAVYELLGFVQAVTGDIRPYPYAVVTDGEVCIGLHAAPLAAPTLSFVRPELARHLAELESRGVEPEVARLGEDAFHEVCFADPAGQRVALLEARTFSGTGLRGPASSRLGRFAGIVIPASNPARSRAFWSALGLSEFEPAGRGAWAGGLEGAGLRLALGAAPWRQAALAFVEPDWRRLADELVRRCGLHRCAFRGGAEDSALLTTPEGTALLLLPEAW